MDLLSFIEVSEYSPFLYPFLGENLGLSTIHPLTCFYIFPYFLIMCNLYHCHTTVNPHQFLSYLVPSNVCIYQHCMYWNIVVTHLCGDSYNHFIHIINNKKPENWMNIFWCLLMHIIACMLSCIIILFIYYDTSDFLFMPANISVWSAHKFYISIYMFFVFIFSSYVKNFVVNISDIFVSIKMQKSLS